MPRRGGFRASVEILPGVRLNVGSKSSSVTLGGKGARTTISSTGRKTTTVRIPGTGISITQRSSTGKKRR